MSNFISILHIFTHGVAYLLTGKTHYFSKKHTFVVKKGSTLKQKTFVFFVKKNVREQHIVGGGNWGFLD